MKLRQRWQQRRQETAPASGAPRPKIASIDQDLAAVVAQVRERAARTGIVYGDAEFRDALMAATPEVTWGWVSHRDSDVLAGAALPATQDLHGYDALVVGGGDVKTAYLNALRWVERGDSVTPVFWVGQSFEYCGSTIPIPAEVEAADIYLFHHFSDFFPIKDPLLVRVSSSDSQSHHERFLMMRPQETVHFTLDDLLPDREGTAVIEVRTTHPALTGNRHPRWRVWADLFWKDSLTSLHGAHDYGPDHVCESRIPLSELRSASLVLTLPNYDHRLSDSDSEVHWARGTNKGTFSRDASRTIQQVNVPPEPHGETHPGFWGYRYQGHGTSYWFAFEEGSGEHRPSIRGNHEVTVAQVEHRPPLSSERREFLESMEERGFLFWPHGLPLLDDSSEIEFGFSFEAANPQLTDFVLVFYDGDGAVLGRRAIALPRSGYHYADDVLPGFTTPDGRRPQLVLVSPDWKTMNIDPQRINACGNLVVRNRRTGDRDVTEFQSCWRNLNATIDGFPHWLHPSKGVVGRTNIVGQVRTARGLRTGILAVNGAGNLSHSTSATVKVRLFAPNGAARTAEADVTAFTGRVLWADELFDGLDQFLGESGYGTVLVTSADADVNCQILTCSTAGSVSLQHMWGY
ncbi:MAG: hypothetical protein WAL77_02790 [Candidatus Dormiibacterota bacterium]